MILGFKPQFVQPIMDGTKIHTLRFDFNHRWKEGVKMHMATGVRTKQYNCFKQDVCNGVQEVWMEVEKGKRDLRLEINWRDLTDEEKVQFAKNDGFDSWEFFLDWFYPIVKDGLDGNLIFKIIHWTDFRY